MAGQIIHGCGLNGVLKHYLDPMTILEGAAKRIPVPKCFGAVAPKRSDAGDLNRLFADLNDNQRSALQQTMRAMLGVDAG
jgi:hypothetical protein